MEKLNINETFIDFTYRSMVNPMNKDFYLNNLTVAQVEKFLTGVDDGLVACFWQAFCRARTYLIYEEISYNEQVELDDIACEYAKHGNFSYYGDVCPECGCKDYVTGATCPNCDYIHN